MGLAGTAVHGLRLASGVGDYAVRVYASNRDVVTRRYTALFDGQRNPLSDEFQQEKRTLEGSSGTWSSSGGNPEPAFLRISRPSYGLAVGSIAVLVGLAWPCCGLLVAAAAAERFGLTWLALDPLALDPLACRGWPRIAGWRTAGCWSRPRRRCRRRGDVGVARCLGRWARNGIIA